MPALHPLLYLAILACAVGVGLPGAALVVGAGALYGPGIGLATVIGGEAAGLALNWRLCRGMLRPRMQRWMEGRRRGRRLRRLLQRPASLRLMLLLRLAAIPMNLVNAACALGPTPLRPYAVASLMLMPRFMLLVLVGEVGAEAVRGTVSPLTTAAQAVALAATAWALVLLARGLRHSLQTGHQDGNQL
jgi:uncharacterized membrane protein YdjX (TVP38/TMEM64 family)